MDGNNTHVPDVEEEVSGDFKSEVEGAERVPRPEKAGLGQRSSGRGGEGNRGDG